MIKIKKLIATETSLQQFVSDLKQRGEQSTADADEVVRKIIADVRENGDAAVRKYTGLYDSGGETPLYYELPKDVIDGAAASADAAFVNALKSCIENITAFHERQNQNGYAVYQENGVVLGRRVQPLDKVGVYVPGGTAAYPSSVLMNVIPAKIAGVGEIVMVTPFQRECRDGVNQDVLTAAKLCGVDRIFLCGGAAAVAALAYGTESIPKVAKIVGPGNKYVAAAKKLLFGTVDIDMIAGPSEILIIADESAKPSYIAADLMSQAEHD